MAALPRVLAVPGSRWAVGQALESVAHDSSSTGFPDHLCQQGTGRGRGRGPTAAPCSRHGAPTMAGLGATFQAGARPDPAPSLCKAALEGCRLPWWRRLVGQMPSLGRFLRSPPTLGRHKGH